MPVRWDWGAGGDPNTVTLSNTPDNEVFTQAQRGDQTPIPLTADKIFEVLGKKPEVPYSNEHRQEAADSNTRYGGSHMVNDSRPKGAEGRNWRRSLRNLEGGGLASLFANGHVWLGGPDG